MKRFSFIWIVLLVFIVSCKESADKNQTSPPETINSPAPVKITSSKDLLWLQGSWMSEDKSTIETWAVQGDSIAGNLYSGAAKKIIEVLNIKKVGKSWVYSSRGLQEDGKNILLDLELYNTKQLVFSNPLLDYPNKVDYTRLDDRTIQITISGKTGNPSSYKIIKLD
jgi:hypothetical protein